MEISKIRQQIYQAEQRRKKLLHYLMSPKTMFKGSGYEMARLCGQPNCRCAKGEKHTSYYLSWSEQGKTKLKYVKRQDEKEVLRGARNYQKYQRRMAELRKLNQKVVGLLQVIRDTKLKEYS